VQIGTWKLGKDSLRLSHMDGVDQNGNSVWTKPNIIYKKELTVSYYLKNDTLIPYGIEFERNKQLIFIKKDDSAELKFNNSTR
jgi:hypothetical protein